MIFWFSLDGGCQEVLNILFTSIKRSAFNHFAKAKWLRMISRTNRLYNALKRSRLNCRQTRWISLIMIKVYKYILVCTLDIYKGLQVYPCLHALVARDVSYSYCTCYIHHVYIFNLNHVAPRAHLLSTPRVHLLSTPLFTAAWSTLSVESLRGTSVSSPHNISYNFTGSQEKTEPQ